MYQSFSGGSLPGTINISPSVISLVASDLLTSLAAQLGDRKQLSRRYWRWWAQPVTSCSLLSIIGPPQRSHISILLRPQARPVQSPKPPENGPVHGAACIPRIR
jgi:hypothetical protein